MMNSVKNAPIERGSSLFADFTNLLKADSTPSLSHASHAIEEQRKKIGRLWFDEHRDVQKFYKHLIAIKGPNSDVAIRLARALHLGLSRCDLENGTCVMIPPKDRLIGGGKQDVIAFRRKIWLLKEANNRLLIPWESNFEVGCGINPEGSLKGQVIKGELNEIKEQSVKTGNYFKVIESEEHKQSLMNLMFKGELHFPGFASSGAIELIDSLKIEENSQTIIIANTFENKIRKKIIQFIFDRHLLEEAEKNLTNYMSKYGSHCIVGYVSGSSFYSQFRITSDSKEALKKRSAEAILKIKSVIYGGEIEGQYKENNLDSFEHAKIEGTLKSTGLDIKGSLLSTGQGVIDSYNEYKEKLQKLIEESSTSQVERPIPPLMAICVPWTEIFGNTIELEKQYRLFEDDCLCKIKELYSEFVVNSLNMGRYRDAADVCINAATGEVDYDEIIEKCIKKEKQNTEQLTFAVGNLLKFGAALRALDEGEGSSIVLQMLPKIKNNIEENYCNQKNFDLSIFLVGVVLSCAELLANSSNREIFRNLTSLLKDQEMVNSCKEELQIRDWENKHLKKWIPTLFHNKQLSLLHSKLDEESLEDKNFASIAKILIEESKKLGQTTLLEEVLDKFMMSHDLFSLFFALKERKGGELYLRKYVWEALPSHKIIVDIVLNEGRIFHVNIEKTIYHLSFEWQKDQTFCIRRWEPSEEWSPMKSERYDESIFSRKPIEFAKKKWQISPKLHEGKGIEEEMSHPFCIFCFNESHEEKIDLNILPK